MKYQIVEDCSPYYIRFTHAGIDAVINKCLEYTRWLTFTKGFTHHHYKADEAKDILAYVPMAEQLKLNPARVSMFVTNPGFYYGAHKDGVNHRYSLNYTVKVHDAECVTSWYSDDDLRDEEMSINELPSLGVRVNYPESREIVGWDKTKYTPVKSMVAVQGEVILFNTDIWHDFDNTTSANQRMVLTLRDVNPAFMYFDDAKDALFNKRRYLRRIEETDNEDI